MIKEIVCFHTCNNEGGKEFILQNAPFHSNESTTQWLGQGYYLWTDSDHYAKEWGKCKPRYGCYVVTKFTLKIDKTDFLDLVGNVEDQLAFFKLVERYKHHIRTEANKLPLPERNEILETLKTIYVSTVIEHYRSENKFPYSVVKAQDTVSKKTQSIRFTPDQRDKAVLFYPTRQQIVVYKHARSLLGPAVLHIEEGSDNQYLG